MNRYKIEGGNKLQGEITVHGAKNAALPILAACIINGRKSIIHNCPDLSDIKNTIEILTVLGCDVERCGNDVYVDSSNLKLCTIPEGIMNKTRSSTVFAGALSSRCKRAYIAGSGGCQIGARPIDIHLDAFKTMGMDVTGCGNAVILDAGNMKPSVIYLRFPSVGATENVMLAASGIPGCTTLYNAAMEPEIVNLASYLRSIGVKITGDGSDVITICGTTKFTDGEVTVIPDRIVASTYILAGLITGGEILVNSVNPRHISPVVATLRKMGAGINCFASSVKVKNNVKLTNVPYISTMPYPGFPTDAQPLMTALMSVSEGVGVVRENIFENRLGHCRRLSLMGANISVNGKYACIKGVKSLHGAHVDACDLRSGASLCVAALAAKGTSFISNIHYIERGYENICADLQSLGAKIERVE